MVSLFASALTLEVVLAFAGLVLLAVLLVVVSVASSRPGKPRRARLDRAARRADRGRPAVLAAAGVVASGRAIERAVAAERRHQLLPATRQAAPPSASTPPGPELVGVTRRQFLNRSILNMVLLALSGLGSATLAFLWPRPSGAFGSKVTLPVDLEGLQSHFDQERAPYYFAAGRFYANPYPKGVLDNARRVYPPSIVAGMGAGIVALYQKCPHLGCRVPWCQTSQWFECPCHGSQYNRVGEKKGGPAPRGLDRFPVVIEGGSVIVDTGTVVQGPPIGTNTTGQEAEGPHCVTAGGE